MLDLVGGKALNLGVMIGAGLPVPGGFCVTTEAYAAVVRPSWDRSTTLDPQRPGGHCARTSPGCPSRPSCRGDPRRPTYRRWAPTPRSRSAPRPPPRTCPARASPDSRTPTSTSSATRRCCDAVRRCWASLWTDRAVAYRQANGIDHRQVALAVVVQEMVASAVAGRDVHRQPGDRHPHRDRHRRQPRPGRGGRLRRGQPRPLRGRPDDRGGPRASARRQAAGDHRPSGRRHRAAAAGRRRAPLPRRRPAAGPGPAGPARAGPLRGPAGHRVGPRRRRAVVAHPGAARDHALSRPGRCPSPGCGC